MTLDSIYMFENIVFEGLQSFMNKYFILAGLRSSGFDHIISYRYMVTNYINTDEFAEILKVFGFDVGKITAYDYLLNDRFYVLNTYGDSDIIGEYYDLEQNMRLLYTLAVVDVNTYELMLVDYAYDLDTDGVVRLLSAKCILPENLHRFSPVEILGGKRAFYWYRDYDKVSLRIHEDVYENIPDTLKHVEAEEWISGPRIILPVEKI